MDNPVFADMHEASALVAGGTLAAARAVLEQTHDHAVNVAGGLHHAMPSSASGFCVYNDPAIAIAWMLAQGVERIAYVDIDAHHGDGVQAAFWDDPRVLTISMHESGRTLFPGTGFPDEIGGAGAEGTAVNVALAAGTGDSGWLRAEAAGAPIDPESDTPDEWRELVHERTETHAPLRMTDGRIPVFARYDGDSDGDDPVDAAIRATRDNVFARHGLAP